MFKYLLSYLAKYSKDRGRHSETFLHFLCDNKDPRRQTSLGVFRSLLLQILFHQRQLFRHIPDSSIEAHRETLRGSSSDNDASLQLGEMLTTVIKKSRVTRFSILIDALDELEPASQKSVIDRLEDLVQGISGGRLRLVLTDRQLSHHFIDISWRIELGLTNSSQDVSSYVHREVQELCQDFSIDGRQGNAIEDGICARAGGVFLHAKLALANFKGGVSHWTPRVIKQRLQGLKALPPSLEAEYIGLLSKIPSDFRLQARRAFLWVLGSATRSGLSVQELHHAVSIDSRQKSWSDLEDDLSYDFEQMFQKYCGYLLKRCDECEIDHVVFAHQTVKELLLKTTPAAREVDERILSYFRIVPGDVDREVVTTCLTLLQYKDFHESTVETLLLPRERLIKLGHKWTFSRAFFKMMRKFPLLDFAIQFWFHLDLESSERSLSTAIAHYLESPYSNYFRLAVAPRTHSSRAPQISIAALLPSELPALHHCIQVGDCPEVVRLLLKDSNAVKIADHDGMTAFHWACSLGRTASLSVLLEMPAINVNKPQPSGFRPFEVALDNHNENILLTLVQDPRTDVNIQNVSTNP